VIYAGVYGAILRHHLRLNASDDLEMRDADRLHLLRAAPGVFHAWQFPAVNTVRFASGGDSLIDRVIEGTVANGNRSAIGHGRAPVTDTQLHWPTRFGQLQRLDQRER
jgi:hypothetical protein